jgi:hypothetical protein
MTPAPMMVTCFMVSGKGAFWEAGGGLDDSLGWFLGVLPEICQSDGLDEWVGLD